MDLKSNSKRLSASGCRLSSFYGFLVGRVALNAPVCDSEMEKVRRVEGTNAPYLPVELFPR